MFLAIFSLVAGPDWFHRDKSGFAQPALNAGLLGLITLLIVPVQILLVAFAMRGFQQGWNVESSAATRRPARTCTPTPRPSPPDGREAAPVPTPTAAPCAGPGILARLTTLAAVAER